MKTKLFFSTIILILFAFASSHAQTHVWALTLNGGAFNQGAIVISNNDGTGLNVAHSFQSPAGYHPYGNLLSASDGNLYGTCYDGGTYGSCTIFRLAPGTGIYTDVVSFDIVHGDYPRSGVVEGPNGILYGAASAGGSAGGGVIYNYDINTGVYNALFNLTSVSGTVPYGNPILRSDGKLYGMTTSGGLYSNGVIYCYDIVNNIYTDVFDFDGTNGSNPKGSLVEGSDGTLYGMTSAGGANSAGVLFSFNPSEGGFSKLFDFATATGSLPQGTLMQATNGLLYGVTSVGGVNSDGVIFSFNPSNGVYNTLHNFNGADGSLPLCKLMQSGNILCGAASSGGTSNEGVMFNYDITSGIYTKVMDFDGNNGANPNGGYIEVLSTTGLANSGMLDQNTSVFPNPLSSENLHVTINSNHREKVSLSLRDVTGSLVYSAEEYIDLNNSATLKMNEYKSGTYFLEIKSGNETVIRKVIKE